MPGIQKAFFLKMQNRRAKPRPKNNHEGQELAETAFLRRRSLVAVKDADQFGWIVIS
jgi:hypothetical protein